MYYKTAFYEWIFKIPSKPHLFDYKTKAIPILLKIP